LACSVIPVVQTRIVRTGTEKLACDVHTLSPYGRGAPRLITGPGASSTAPGFHQQSFKEKANDNEANDNMKSDLAIATLIRSRLTELGLSRGEFVKRLGYKNIAKGIRLCEGNIEGTKQFMDVLPRALETSAEIVTLALDQTVRELELAEKQEAEVRDKIWRENFRPHAIILTERSVPSPIFVAAMIGVEKLLRIDLDATQGPVSFVRQVLDRLPEGVPAFGKPMGFVINYSPDKAVRFDSNGQPIAMLDKAVRPGTAVLLRLGGRPIPAEALRLVFDN
jgi:hypothetical protein